MSVKSSRNSSLDFMRICSILAVITIHSICYIVVNSPIGSKRWMLSNIIDSCVRWSVPVFVMLSGALSIKDSAFLERKEFLKNKMTRIIIPIIAWPLIYAVWNYLLYRVVPSNDAIIGGYISGSPVPGHLYFLFLIAGVYLFAPIISLYAMSVSKRSFFIATMLVLCLTSIWYIIVYLMPEYSGGQQQNALTQGLPYVGYFMLGCALKDVKLKMKWIPFVAFFLGGTILSFATYYMSMKYGIDKGMVFWNYTSLPIMIMAASAFLMINIIYEKIISLFSNKIATKINKILMELSNATFGVYLIHIMFLSFAINILGFDSLSYKQMFCVFILTTIASYTSSLILGRIPYIKALVK